MSTPTAAPKHASWVREQTGDAAVTSRFIHGGRYPQAYKYATVKATSPVTTDGSKSHFVSNQSHVGVTILYLRPPHHWGTMKPTGFQAYLRIPEDGKKRVPYAKAPARFICAAGG